jgi:2-polyprenyl-6-methoxyphenol hydroxylase-like FAD-dependent oxidoreductase
MLLGRDGHDITVLERDAFPVPESPSDAWEHWARAGVAQFRQPHYLLPRARHVLDSELPDVRDALVAAGALRFDTLLAKPPSLAHLQRQPGDEQFVTLTARRPTLEQVIARAAEAERRVEVRRGVTVTGLTTRDFSGIPHVVGVRTNREDLRADLVVDATGRRSPLPGWLRDAGAVPLIEENEDSGFVYYTRYFRSRNGSHPEPRDRLGLPVGSFSILTLPADNGTWSVTLFGSSGDQPLKQLRDPGRWTAVLAACPRHAHWLEGEPITSVLPMAGILDRYRRLVAADRPVVTGLAAIGDAWACTNPSLGRGVSLGLSHAVCLRNVVRLHLDDDPQAFAKAWDATTETTLTPWYRATVAVDRARLAEIEALRTGVERPIPGDPAAVLAAAFPRAMLHDADIFRAFLEIASCLTLPSAVFARPGFADRVMEVDDRDRCDRHVLRPLKVTLMAAFLLALPYVLWQAWAFVGHAPPPRDVGAFRGPRQARAHRLDVLDNPPLAHEADGALELFGLLAPDQPFRLRGHRGAARGGEAAEEGRETGTALAPAEARHRSFVRTKAPRGDRTLVRRAIKKYSCIDSWWRSTLTAQEADDGYGARRNPGPGLFAVRGRA